MVAEKEENKTTDTENATEMAQTTEPPLDSIPSAPSFSYLAENATTVIQELRSNDDDSNDTLSLQNDTDFEFCFVPRHPDSFPISADDIFQNGQIRPTYPLFNQNAVVPTDQPRRLPLRELMLQERLGKVNDGNDDLDGVPEGSYCVWTPPCKKTNSSSSKRWKLLDLLPRSHSTDGKRTSSKVAPKHSSAHHCPASAKFASFFNNAH